MVMGDGNGWLAACSHNFVTHNFVTHIFVTYNFVTRTTLRHPPSFHVAGVVLVGLGGSGDALGPAVMPRLFAW